MSHELLPHPPRRRVDRLMIPKSELGERVHSLIICDPRFARLVQAASADLLMEMQPHADTIGHDVMNTTAVLFQQLAYDLSTGFEGYEMEDTRSSGTGVTISYADPDLVNKAFKHYDRPRMLHSHRITILQPSSFSLDIRERYPIACNIVPKAHHFDGDGSSMKGQFPRGYGLLLMMSLDPTIKPIVTHTSWQTCEPQPHFARTFQTAPYVDSDNLLWDAHSMAHTLAAKIDSLGLVNTQRDERLRAPVFFPRHDFRRWWIENYEPIEGSIFDSEVYQRLIEQHEIREESKKKFG